MSEVEYDNWFVLGSGEYNEALDEESVTVEGGATNGSTRPAPFVSLIVCEADPDYTPEPTKVPATQAPTKEPTEAPTQAPATEAPTENAAVEEPTDAAKTPGNDDRSTSDKKVNTGLIIGIIAAAIVVIAAVVLIIMAAKKKKK